MDWQVRPNLQASTMDSTMKRITQSLCHFKLYNLCISHDILANV